MKTARDYISKIVTNKANLNHIADYGVINGSLLIDFEKAMKLFANQKLDEAKHLVSLQETKVYTTPDIDKGFSQGIDAAMESILSLKYDI